MKLIYLGIYNATRDHSSFFLKKFLLSIYLFYSTYVHYNYNNCIANKLYRKNTVRIIVMNIETDAFVYLQYNQYTFFLLLRKKIFTKSPFVQIPSIRVIIYITIRIIKVCHVINLIDFGDSLHTCSLFLITEEFLLLAIFSITKKILIIGDED